jgi:hypothetical protein
MAPISIASSLTRKNTLALLDKLATQELIESGGFLFKKYFKVETTELGYYVINCSVTNRAGMQLFERYKIRVSQDSASPHLDFTREWDFSQVARVVAGTLSVLAAPISIAYFMADAGWIGWVYLPRAVALGLVLAGLICRGLINAPSECKRFLEIQLSGTQ